MEDNNCFELTVEDASTEFSRLRDLKDCEIVY